MNRTKWRSLDARMVSVSHPILFIEMPIHDSIYLNNHSQGNDGRRNEDGSLGLFSRVHGSKYKSDGSIVVFVVGSPVRELQGAED